MQSVLFHFTSVRQAMTTSSSYTLLQVFCVACSLLCNRAQQISFSKRKPLFSPASLSWCCFDFWSDSPNVISAAHVCVLSDVISASVSVFLQIVCVCVLRVFTCVCQLLLDLCALRLRIKWTCELQIALALIQPLMTAVWVDLWFMQTDNVSSGSHDSPPSPPPLATGNSVLFASSRNFPYVSCFLPRTLLF